MDFITKVINIYTDLFTKYRGIAYTADEKDRSAVGKLLKKYKAKNKSDSKKTLEDFDMLFTKCLQITSSNWLRDNMTLPIINSKLNEIKLVIKKEDQDRRVIKRNAQNLEDLKYLEKIVSPQEAKRMFAMPRRQFNKIPQKVLTKTEFLKRFGAGRLNEFEAYKIKCGETSASYWEHR